MGMHMFNIYHVDISSYAGISKTYKVQCVNSNTNSALIYWINSLRYDMSVYAIHTQ